nr:flavin reductase family protein [Micromonospora sp. HNM0581]
MFSTPFSDGGSVRSPPTTSTPARRARRRRPPRQCADSEALGRRFATSRPDKFAGVDWQASPLTGVPHRDGALTWIDSVIRDVVPGDDPTILIGQVVAVHHAPDAGEPLLFFNGGFCDLATGQPCRAR